MGDAVVNVGPHAGGCMLPVLFAAALLFIAGVLLLAVPAVEMWSCYDAHFCP
jgi:hypothetical protein